ncbi:3-succinoylsemialdehyde-pyridine dehydrogenase (plasmid) [Burkholderia sp. AD24]|nr:3-succinoylsemialdehyde-pyridine dehydrogenase [Burkholderia sp. AD24]
MQHRDKIYVNGHWVNPRGEGTIEVRSASTEAVIGRIPAGNEQDADAAVAAASRAWAMWSTTSAQQRADYLSRIHTSLECRSELIARTIADEVGMPLKLSSRIQVAAPIAQLEFYARLVEVFDFEHTVGNSRVLREPVGVVACITPWNYPLHQIMAKVAPALAAGCTVVLKPSEIAPLSAFMLADAIDEAGLPPGVFNLVTGSGACVGEAIVRHSDVDMISFTGSTRAGRHIASVAGQTIKRIALELGGKSAAVILGDADFAVAIKNVVGSCFLNSGQTCTAHTRMLVPESRYIEAAELAVEAAKRFAPGDPFVDGTRLGPLASAAQRDSVRQCIVEALAEGAELLCGGPQAPVGLDQGYYVLPTVLGRVAPASRLAQDEMFGPVLAILSYPDGDEEEAIRIANNSIYGLSGAVWSSSDERAIAVARRMRTGQVDINGGSHNPLAPFGGYKQSGLGRELGRYGLEAFLEYKSLQLKTA